MAQHGTHETDKQLKSYGLGTVYDAAFKRGAARCSADADPWQNC